MKINIEDLESLRWKQSIITRDDIFIFDGRYMLKFKDNVIVISNLMLGDKKLFEGTIKNKSEFKKLMQQLNIKKEEL